MNRIIALVIGLLAFVPVTWAEQAQVIELEVTGMTCQFCVFATEKELKKIPGVANSEVSLEKNMARIEIVPGQTVDMDAIRKAITEAGFKPGKIIEGDAATTHK